MEKEWEKVSYVLQLTSDKLDHIRELILSEDRNIIEANIKYLQNTDGEGWAIGETIQRILDIQDIEVKTENGEGQTMSYLKKYTCVGPLEPVYKIANKVLVRLHEILNIDSCYEEEDGGIDLNKTNLDKYTKETTIEWNDNLVFHTEEIRNLQYCEDMKRGVYITPGFSGGDRGRHVVDVIRVQGFEGRLGAVIPEICEYLKEYLVNDKLYDVFEFQLEAACQGYLAYRDAVKRALDAIDDPKSSYYKSAKISANILREIYNLYKL